MKKFTLSLKMFFFLLLSMVFMAFAASIALDEDTAFIQKMLADHYDDTQEASLLKKYELNVTNTGFCRYKRYFSSGKVEYFSFNLKKFKDIDYLGSDKQGRLYLHTKGEDVIVQTYNDRKNGDIDSMAAYMVIPLKNMEPQDLIAISERLVKTNAQLLVQK
ncbi:hypothetical protein [Pedobacter frigoris]|uniref:Uncharacterized protein n=1 Tax=Pedobacter frigoris TaxID=2571272 RepID=A0A4U1CLG4_9SPHI|nr:hypothetical protein [Pedobacter frigoris]TKC07141.1 hypothetical protein FA047_07740 [Pedobacter frigoris]